MSRHPCHCYSRSKVSKWLWYVCSVYYDTLRYLDKCATVNLFTEISHTHTTILRLSGFCPEQTGWAGTRRNIHPLTPIVVISHPLSASSICYIHGILSVQFIAWQSFSTICPGFLVYLLAWHPQLQTPYIYSPNHCLQRSITWQDIDAVFVCYFYWTLNVETRSISTLNIHSHEWPFPKVLFVLCENNLKWRNKDNDKNALFENY